MAENKSSFIIYTDWKQDFEFLTNDEAGKLIKHLLQFASDENPTMENEDRLLQFAAQKMKAVMKKDLKKYEAVVKKRSDAGKKGGVNSGLSRTSKQNEANEANASKLKQNERVNDNVNDNDILLEKESKYVVEACENSDDKKKFYDLLTNSQTQYFDRLMMQHKISKEKVLDKAQEFLNKKFDWEENTWKNEGDMKRNFEFWLKTNAHRKENPFDNWTVEEFKTEVGNADGKFSKVMLTAFYRHWIEETPSGKMRFQEQKAWNTLDRLKKWKRNETNFVKA